MRHRLPLCLLLASALAPAVDPAEAGLLWPAGGVPVCTAASNQFTPSGVADGAGGALLAWYDYRSGNADIYAHRLLSSGVTDPAWPAGGRLVCGAGGGQYSPVAVADGAGGAIVVWYDDRGSSSDIYAQRVLASGAVDPAWPVNGRALCAASADQVYPVAVSDGAGGAIVAWRDYRGGPDTDIYAQRVLASGAVDPAWPANGRAICTAANNQSVPAIAPDGAGGALIAWSDLRPGSHSDIYVQRVLASGAVDPAWPANGRALCTAAGNQSGPTIVSDGAGGAIVAWFDSRSALGADIYAQRVLATGTVDPAWPADGRALCVAPGEQYSPIVIPDGAGGAVLAWYDYRAGEEPDVYAHHVTASGAADPQWPVDGRALCTAAGEQSSPALTGDGAGGAYVAWFDYRADPAADVFGHHVLAGGALDPGWPADGDAVCAVAGSQFSPAVVPDGAGGAIVAWTDFRGGVYADIYAQRVAPGGAVVAVGGGRDPAFRLHPARPNPARAGLSAGLELAAAGRVTVEIVDVAGRTVRTLLAGRELAAGRHELWWDGRDAAGARAAAGAYWMRVRGPAGARARALLLAP